VRAAEDTDAAGAAIAREEQVVLLVDKDAGDARKIGEGAQEAARGAVQYFDPVGARVRDVHLPVTAMDVGMVEPGLWSRRDRDEADPGEGHVSCSRRSCRPRARTSRRARRRPVA